MPRGQKTEGRRKTREKGKGTREERGDKERPKGMFDLEWDKGLLLDRWGNRLTHRQMVLYIEKMGNASWNEVFNFNWVCR